MRILPAGMLLALALAGCGPRANVGTATDAPVADLLLTTADLDQLRPGVWTEAEPPAELEVP